MGKSTFTFLVLLPALFCAQTKIYSQNVNKSGPAVVVPETRVSQVLFSHAQAGERPYLAFPALLRLNEKEVLITFKRGTSHGADREADCEVIRFNTVTNKVTEHRPLGAIPGRRFQLTVPVRMPDRTIHFYTDLQHQGDDGRHYREGMHFGISRDEGKTVESWVKAPLVDGVEYGYPLDFIVEGKTVYMLAMSFGYRPGGIWSVAALKSEDGARSWKRIRNLSEELGGGAFNESCFTRVGNEFVVVLRGYKGQETRIARFTDDFRLIADAELTGKDKLLEGYIGWPRIFHRDGNLYVLGRVFPKVEEDEKKGAGSSYMRLGLLRINPESLSTGQIAYLDNEDGSVRVADGYYAAPYWQEAGGQTWFNAVTYRTTGNSPPDIVRLGFLWDEVK